MTTTSTGPTTTTTTRTSTRGKRTRYPMVEDLAHVPVSLAADLARSTWAPMNLYPGDIDAILPTVTAIENWALDNNAANLLDIDASKMLLQLAGVTTLTGKLTTKKRDQLHLLRNTLSALRGTVLFNSESFGRRRSDRPASDSLDRDLPKLPRRCNLTRRPLTDDETLLGNILVEIDLLEDAPVGPITAYLLGAAGVHNMESNELTTDHLDDRTEPTTVSAKGLWGWTPKRRDVALDDFTRTALSRTLARTAPGPQRLTYFGTQPGTKEAAASLAPVLTRFLRRAGISDPDVTAKSLSVTRPHRIIRQTANFKAAKAIHGGKTANLLVDIKCTTDEETLHKGKIRILDHTGRPVAKVKARHLFDSKPKTAA